MINYQNPIIQQDLETLWSASIEWDYLKNKTIVVTGATGMIATYFVFMLLYLNEKYNYNIQLLLLARNKNKLEQIFGKRREVKFIVQDVCDRIIIPARTDYILHAAGSASPYAIIHDPIGIIKANTMGTINVLEMAKLTTIKKVLFTSTREIYGKVENITSIKETDMGILDPLDPRSCYPESKRMAETLLKSYSIQYNINFNSLRIAHTYGPGMQTQNDGRVMADFMDDALNNRDIQLNSDGTAERAFCYLTDTIEAIFRVLINGINNEAYNISNETEPISIINLAYLIQKISGNNKTVKISKKEISKHGYTNYSRIKLDTSKIETLGWKPKISLVNGIDRTLKSFK
jgi:UDP-glucuronate decarboxylase